MSKRHRRKDGLRVLWFLFCCLVIACSGLGIMQVSDAVIVVILAKITDAVYR